MLTKKIVIIGPAQIGKSHLVNIWSNQGNVNWLGLPIMNYEPTLGVTVTPVQHQNYIYNIWDTAGNPQFRGLANGYYVEADGLVCILDQDNMDQEIGNKITDFQVINPGKPILIVKVNVNEQNQELCYANINQVPIDILKAF